MDRYLPDDMPVADGSSDEQRCAEPAAEEAGDLSERHVAALTRTFWALQTHAGFLAGISGCGGEHHITVPAARSIAELDPVLLELAACQLEDLTSLLRSIDPSPSDT